jgi:hypothetical protein
MDFDDVEIILKRANADACFLVSAKIDPTVSIGDKVYEVQGVKSTDLSTKQKATIMDILRDNMRVMYEENGWGWKEVEKKKEVFDKRSRFVLLTDQVTRSIVGYVIFRYLSVPSFYFFYLKMIFSPYTFLSCLFFCILSSYRFEWDDEDEPDHPVLYCYELQIASVSVTTDW